MASQFLPAAYKSTHPQRGKEVYEYADNGEKEVDGWYNILLLQHLLRNSLILTLAQY